MTRYKLPIETTFGVFVACYSDAGLCSLDFPRNKPMAAALDPVPLNISNWHRLATRAVEATLAGRPVRDLPPFDVVGTDFQKAVWKMLRELGPGQTTTYGALAKQLQNPNASRAIGAACGANPIPVIIPCHRVLASNGGLGGFSGGLAWKRKLLAVEGVCLSL